MKNVFVQMQNLYSDRKGITGLETAIILIAFIVVAAVFAFTVMTTGLFSTEKAKTTAQAGIAEASSTFAPKGAVIASANGAKKRGGIDHVPNYHCKRFDWNLNCQSQDRTDLFR